MKPKVSIMDMFKKSVLKKYNVTLTSTTLKTALTEFKVWKASH